MTSFSSEGSGQNETDCSFAAEKPIDPGAPQLSVPVFDKAALLDRTMQDEDIARAVMVGFLDDFPKQIASFKISFAPPDPFAIQRGLHNMKGVASTVSAEELRACAEELEHAAKQGDFETVRLGIERIEECFARLEMEMRR